MLWCVMYGLVGGERMCGGWHVRVGEEVVKRSDRFGVFRKSRGGVIYLESLNWLSGCFHPQSGPKHHFVEFCGARIHSIALLIPC